jgi:Domain of unknown function (DUF4397)
MLASLMLLAPAAGSAFAAAKVRFVHAVPGAGAATLVVESDGREVEVGPPARFAQATGYASVSAGDAELALRLRGRTESVATGRLELRDGRRYTAVAFRSGGKVELRVYPDGRPAAGAARLRAIHAAAELDDVDVRLGDRVVASRLGRGAASGYERAEPGTYELQATRPTGRGGALASRSGLSLAAGTSSTAIIVGSGGAPTRFLVTSDAAVAPSEPPTTGFGGLSDGAASWLLVLAAALLGGSLGGAGYALRARRARG